MLPKDWDKVNRFSPELFQSIQNSLDPAADQKVAAFDADGTLWDTDLGEAFFRYQIQNCPLPGLTKDPWGEYQRRKSDNYALGCLWLAQINAGQSLSQVREWAEACFQSLEPVPIFENARRWIDLLQAYDFDIYIITASTSWSVEPAARRLGIPIENVLGMHTSQKNGLLTDEGIEPLTYAAGKAKALITRRNGTKPQICFGNSSGDVALLESATHAAVAVKTQTEGTELFESEMKLQLIAAERGWLTHHYR